MSESLRAAGLARINGLRFSPDLNVLLHRGPGRQFNGERNRFARTQDQLVIAGEKVGGVRGYDVLAALNRSKMEPAFRVSNGPLRGTCGPGMCERYLRTRNGRAGRIPHHAFYARLGERECGCKYYSGKRKPVSKAHERSPNQENQFVILP